MKIGYTLSQILTKNFILVTTINFLVMIVYYQIFVTSAIFAQDKFNLNLSLAGFSAGIMVIGCLSGRFVTGSLLGYFSCKKVLIFGTTCYTALALALYIIDTPWLLFAQRFLSGAAVGIIGTITSTIMAYSVPYIYHGLGVSIFSLSTALALALGPFFGISIITFFSFTILNIDTITLDCIIIILSLLLAKPQDFPLVKKSLLKLSNYIDVRVIKFALVPFLIAISYGCISAYLPMFAKAKNLSEVASIFFLISAGTTMLTRPISGRIYDQHGENIIIYPAIFITSISLLILAFSSNIYTFVLAAILNGLGFGNFQSVAQSISLHLVKKYRYPQATSTFFIFFDFGIGLGPYIFGFIVSSLGYDFMFMLLSAITFISLFIYYAVHGKKHQYLGKKKI